MHLTGVIPANILPFDEDLEIDEQAYRAHLDTLVETDGVTAITCNGHAAEVSSLSRVERRRALAIAVETVGGRAPVICGVYADDEQDATRYAADARAEGVDALLVFPPNSLLYDDEPGAAHRYFRHLSAAADLPMVAFVYPKFTDMQYDATLLTRICAVDNVVAVKEWSLDIGMYERTLDVVRSAPHDVSLLTSFSTHLLPTLAVGADGILSGHGCVIAHLHAQLFSAMSEGDLSAAREVYARIQCLTPSTYRAPMPNMYARMKEQLGMLGHPVQPYVRPPLRRVSADEREQLRQALVTANLSAMAVR